MATQPRSRHTVRCWNAWGGTSLCGTDGQRLHCQAGHAYLGYSNFVTALEGLLIGAKAGIDLGILAQIGPDERRVSRTFDNIPRSVFSGEFTSGGTLDIVAKDLHLACELAREVGAPVSACSPMMCCSAPRPRAGEQRLSHRGAHPGSDGGVELPRSQGQV